MIRLLIFLLLAPPMPATAEDSRYGRHPVEWASLRAAQHTGVTPAYHTLRRAARRAERSSTWWLGWVAWGAAILLFSAAVSWWVLGGFIAFVGGVFGGDSLRRAWRKIRRAAGALVVVLTLFQTLPAQEFVSPYSFVVYDGGADIYHTPVQVVISPEGFIIIGAPREDAAPFIIRYTKPPTRTDTFTTYNTDQGTVVYATDRLGQSVTWYADKFIWRLYSFLPIHTKIQK
jgi:hypothetical protein